MIKKLPIILFALCIITPKTKPYTNKTAFSPQLQSLITIHLQACPPQEATYKPDKDFLGGTFTAIPFYGNSTNRNEIGKYFGFDNKNTIKLGTDIDASAIINGSTSTATIKLTPQQIDSGVTLIWNQKLSNICKNLAFMLILPVEHKEQDMRLKANDPSIINYFTGGSVKNQAPLQHAKMLGNLSATGLFCLYGDLNYKFLNNENYGAKCKFAIVAPTGKYGKASAVFSPSVKLRPWVWGAGLSAHAFIWKNKDHAIKGNFAFTYYYLMEITSNRTLGLKNTTWGQYRLATVHGQPNPTPAANLITTDIKHTPGNQFNTAIGLSYNHHGLSTDLGYNLYLAGKEKVKYKRHIIAPTLVGAATPSKIDISAAAVPPQVTNGVYGSIGYAFKQWDSPVTLSFGCRYENTTKNSALSLWQAWGKVSISF